MAEDDKTRIDATNEAEAPPASESSSWTADEKKNVLAYRNLASHVYEVFKTNAEFRQTEGIDDELLKCLRQSRATYSDEDLAKIAAVNAPVVYIPIGNIKRIAFKAWVSDIFSNSNDKPWTIAATPVPAMSPDLIKKAVQSTMEEALAGAMEGGEMPSNEEMAELAFQKRKEIEDGLKHEADDRASKMELLIHDKLIQGRWYAQLAGMIDNVATYGTGLIEGPIVRKRRRINWEVSNGRYVPKSTDVFTLEWDAFSPFDAFPSPGAIEAQDGDFCRRIRIEPSALAKMKGTDNYLTHAIETILTQVRSGAMPKLSLNSDEERMRLEAQGSDTDRKTYMEGIKFWGNVDGELLIGLGITRTDEDEAVDMSSYYNINAIVIDQQTVYCRIIPAGEERPISKATYDRAPGQWWGSGVLRIVRDIERVANASVRSMLVNMAMSSGPQGYIDDYTRIDPKDDMKARPWKMWMCRNPSNSPSQPIHFFNIPIVTRELMDVYDRYVQMADEVSGIPAYTYGNEKVAGAGRTSSGLSMLMGAASRILKLVIGNFDETVIAECINRMFVWLMLYHEDESVKGDVEIHARGLNSLNVKEQLSIRRMEFLTATNNELDQKIIGIERRANMLREVGRTLELSPDDVAPSKEEMRQQIAKEQEEMQAQQEMLAQLQQQTAQGAAGGEGNGLPPEEGGGIPPPVPAEAGATA